MKFITGGIYAGKYERLRALGFAPDEIADGRDVPFGEAFAKPALYKLNALVRRLLAAGEDPMEFVAKQAALHPDIVITPSIVWKRYQIFSKASERFLQELKRAMDFSQA